MPERGAQSMRHALPNVIIIGAGKCGTTSLHTYLDLHPAIAMTREKELHFFANPEVWQRGLDWYSSQFDAHAPVRGEASVKYTAWPKWKGVPERMASVVPEARLLYVVRDPIQRILSSWVHRYSDADESRPIRDVLEVLEGNDYVERSRYYRQLEQYLPFYEKSRIHVISSEALRANRRDVLAETFDFLFTCTAFRRGRELRGGSGSSRQWAIPVVIDRQNRESVPRISREGEEKTKITAKRKPAKAGFWLANQ